MAADSEDCEGDIHPVEVSMSWFKWHFRNALREAVRVHGVDAMGVAWTAQDYLERHFPASGRAKIYDPNGVKLDEVIDGKG